jgi:hypothetical protein
MAANRMRPPHCECVPFVHEEAGDFLDQVRSISFIVRFWSSRSGFLSPKSTKFIQLGFEPKCSLPDYGESLKPTVS